MTVVLVHGNPETGAVWDPLVGPREGRCDPAFPAGLRRPAAGRLARDLPGLPRLAGRRVVAPAGPVDLVGHDWGGNHVVNVMMHRPELVRSWVSDIIGVFDPDYVWHDAALVWQTPGDGEVLADAMLGGTLQDRTDRMVGLGITPEVAAKIATAPGPGNGSGTARAVPPGAPPRLAEAGRSLERAAARPGLPSSRPKTTTSGRSRFVAGLRRAREPAPKCSTGSATGGWCRIRHGVRPR